MLKNGWISYKSALIQGSGIGSSSLALLFSLFLLGCEASSTARTDIEAAFNPGLEIPATPASPTPSLGCFNDRYTQPSAAITKKVDLLFLLDTSGSLDEERLKVSDGVDAFITALPLDVDYRIGIMLAHGGRSTHSGRLYSYSRTGSAKVLRSDLLTLAEVRAGVRSDLTHVRTDSDTDGGEIGMYSLTRSLDDDRLSEIRSQGFYRNDAALAVVIITDENDICADFPAGVTPVPDPERSEARAKSTYCTRIAPAHVVDGVTITPSYSEKITPASLLRKLQDLQAGRPLVVSAIAYTNVATVPRSGENEYGYGTLDLVGLANGVKVEMTDASYVSGLSQIGALTSVKLNLQKEFPLTQRILDSQTLVVKVDGRSVPFTYIPEMNSVSLDELGTAESTIDISYCEPAPVPSPSPEVTPSPTPTGVTGVDPICQTGSFTQKLEKVGISIDPAEGSSTSIRAGFAAMGIATTLYTDAEVAAGKLVSDGVTVLVLTRKVVMSATTEAYVSGVRAYLASGGSLLAEYDGAALLFTRTEGLNVSFTGHFTPSIGIFSGNVAGGGLLLPLSYSSMFIIDPTHPITLGLPTPVNSGARAAFAVSGFSSEWLTPLATFSASGLTGSIPAGTFPAVLVGRCGQGRVAAFTMNHFQALTDTNVQLLVKNAVDWLLGR